MLWTALAWIGGLVGLELLLRLTVGERMRLQAAEDYVRLCLSTRNRQWIARIRSGNAGAPLTTAEKFDLLWLYMQHRYLRGAVGDLLPQEPDAPHTGVPRERAPARLLGTLRWFCGKETRELIDLVRADLARDRRDMRAEGRGPAFIWFQQTVVEWREIVGIVYRFAVRLAVAANPLARLIDRQ